MEVVKPCIYTEWLDWTQLIGGATMVFYFEDGEHYFAIL